MSESDERIKTASMDLSWVPYEGKYTVNGDTQQVSKTAIREGKVLSTYRAHYPFDSGDGSKFSDPVGGSRGTITGAPIEATALEEVLSRCSKNRTLR